MESSEQPYQQSPRKIVDIDGPGDELGGAADGKERNSSAGLKPVWQTSGSTSDIVRRAGSQQPHQQLAKIIVDLDGAEVEAGVAAANSDGRLAAGSDCIITLSNHDMPKVSIQEDSNALSEKDADQEFKMHRSATRDSGISRISIANLILEQSEATGATTSVVSSFSAGRNVHDATIVFISLCPLTAAIKRLVWQLVYACIATFFLCTAIRSMMRLGWLFIGVAYDPLKCPAAESVVLVLTGQMGISIVAAIVLARLERPRYAIKLIGISVLMAAFLSIVAVIVDLVTCTEPLHMGLSYGSVVPQLFAVAYVFLFDECRWQQVLFFCGCANMIVGGILSYVLDVLFFNVVGSGTVLTFYCSFSYIWYRCLLYKAVQAMRPFKTQYDNLWLPVTEQQGPDLEALAAVVRGHTQRKQLQPVFDVDELMQTAKDIDTWYQDVVLQWAEDLHLIHKSAPLKNRGRVLEKIERSYMGDVQRVLDLVRASIVVDTIKEATEALELVLSQANVLVVKCRYDLEFDATATNGYRDINLQLVFSELKGTRFEGFVFELQIVLAEFFNIKAEGQHEKYIECRNLRGN